MSKRESGAVSYIFGPFTLTPARRRLTEGDRTVVLGGRAFDLLVALIEGRSGTLSKEDLLRAVWPDGMVEENNLTVTISLLRKGLRDPASSPYYIRTIPSRGYRFVGTVVQAEAPPYDVKDHAPFAQPTISETVSIAVLPFTTMSADRAQEHFGDGIAEDILSALSRNRWLTVIARNSSFTFRGAQEDVPGIARKLGVRYVLGGSVRTAGPQVRVSVHLMDAATNSQLVAQSYDRELSDLFAVQDEITALIIEAVRPALIEAEQERSMRKHPDSLDAWAAYQRGVWHFARFEQPASSDARSWFERAIALDARFAPGHYGLAMAYLHDGSGYVPGMPADWQQRGEALALRAVALDPRDSGAHGVLALARMVRGDHEGALAAADAALALNPSESTAYGVRGATLVFSGRPAEGVVSIAHALRLSPHDPRLHVRMAQQGLGHFFAGHYDLALATAASIIDRWPSYPTGPRLLAMIYGETGRPEEGRAAIEAAKALSAAPFDDFTHARMPWYGKAAFDRTLAALMRTGWTPGD